MITSKTNELIKHIKSLSQKKYRDDFQEYVIEGHKLVKEAIAEKEEIVKIIVSESAKESFEIERCEIISDELFAYLSDTKTPQGVLAVVKKKVNQKGFGNTVFALEDVQDPGNVGTILRSLDAAGIPDVILSEACADVYSPKVVRSTMGGIFRMNMRVTNQLVNMLKELKQQGYHVVVTYLHTEEMIYDIPFEEKQIVVIGNESKGVSQVILDLADQKVKIPMIGKTESLNAAVAASIVAFEAVRQKIRK